MSKLARGKDSGLVSTTKTFVWGAVDLNEKTEIASFKNLKLAKIKK